MVQSKSREKAHNISLTKRKSMGATETYPSIIVPPPSWAIQLSVKIAVRQMLERLDVTSCWPRSSSQDLRDEKFSPRIGIHEALWPLSWMPA